MLKKQLLVTSAIAGIAMFATAATAEIKLSGSATYTHQIYDDSTNGVDANPVPASLGQEMTLDVAASGDLNNGMKWAVTGTIEDGGPFQTHEVKITSGILSMGAGTDTSHGIESVKDLVPHVNNRRSDIAGGGRGATTLFGSDVLDNTSGENFVFADVKTEMGTISAAYTPNTGTDNSLKEDMSTTSAGTSGGSASSVSFKGNFGVEGLTAGIGYMKGNTVTAANDDPKSLTYGFKYAAGQFALGAARQVNNYDSASASAVESTTDELALTYSVNDALSVGVIYSPIETTTKNAATVDSDLTAVQVGYSLGAVALGYDYVTMDNAAQTANRDVVLHKFTLKAAF
jgi:hypothetical protein